MEGDGLIVAAGVGEGGEEVDAQHSPTVVVELRFVAWEGEVVTDGRPRSTFDWSQAIRSR